jgi:hypothetical protein
MGRFLRPYLESGEVTVICETTAEGYVATRKHEPSFLEAFTRIDVPETGEPDTAAILHAVARQLEVGNDVAVDPTAVAAVVELTRRFRPYQAYPGKAVRLLEEVATAARRDGPGDAVVRVVDRHRVIAHFSAATGLPELLLSDERVLRPEEIRAYFEARLLGQPEAIEAMVDLIATIKAGLTDPAKPLGSFFFVGPTGVGKTELAKVLAEFLFGHRDRLLRFDMSEFAAGDALPRLVGSAWEADGEGELTRRVREQPLSVVLLDEIEKAHRGVFDALLSVLGEGRLTDAAGRTADFRNAIVIMTSNLGAARRQMEPLGFGRGGARGAEDADEARAHFVAEAERFFRPEFFNRIDRIVAFRPLDPETVRLIIRRELGKLFLRDGIVRRGLLVDVDEALVEHLAAAGFHPLYGARPLQRTIERLVVAPLARLVVGERARPGQLLRLGLRDGSVDLAFVPLAEVDQEEMPRARPRPPLARDQGGGDLAANRRAIVTLREQLAEEGAAPGVQRLRDEVAALLERTRDPAFWNEPAEARKVLGRVFELERVLKRLDELIERADYLAERGRQIQIHHDRHGAIALAAERDELAEQVELERLELASVVVRAGPDQAILEIRPIGREAGGWAERLRAMYASWAERRGYEHQCFDVAPGPLTGRDVAGRQRSVALFIRGPGVSDLLAGEAGLHRLSTSVPDDYQRGVARVVIHPMRVDLPDGESRRFEMLARLLTEARDADTGSDNAVARLYHEGRHRFVRDPRTGLRRGDFKAVVEEGKIDAFLLASLQQRASCS